MSRHPSFAERRFRRRGTVSGEPERNLLEVMVAGTYREMPGLALRLPEAARLFGLREGTCQIVFDDLVQQGRLRQGADGRYVGPDDCAARLTDGMAGS